MSGDYDMPPVDMESASALALRAAWRAGAEAMREAAAKAECKYCREGVPHDASGHHDREVADGPWSGWTNMPRFLTCRALMIRSLAIPEDRT